MTNDDKNAQAKISERFMTAFCEMKTAQVKMREAQDDAIDFAIHHRMINCFTINMRKFSRNFE